MAWSRLRFLAKHQGARAAWREGLRQARRLAGKMAGHALTLQGAKLRRDAAALGGTLAWLGGRGHGGGL
jgi:hypothetical protein